MVAVALGIGLAFGGFWTFFICAEIVSDPGGWAGVLWAAAVVVPMLVLSVLAWWVPRVATWILGALVGVFVVGNIVAAFFGTQWAGFEETHGPVGLVASLALCVPCVVLGRTRPFIASVFLLAATLVTIVVAFASLIGVRGMVGLAVLTVDLPFIATAVLLLTAGVLERPGRRDVP